MRSGAASARAPRAVSTADAASPVSNVLRCIFCSPRCCCRVRRARSAPRCPGRRRCTWSRARACAPRVSSAFTAVIASRAPDTPSGWPSAMAPPCGLTCSASSGRPSWRSHRQRLRGERLVQLDHVDVADGKAESCQQLARRRRRADAHDARRDAGASPSPPRAPAASARAAAPPPPMRSDQRRRAVVHARRIAGGHGAVACGTASSASPAPPAWCRGADARHRRR